MRSSLPGSILGDFGATIRHYLRREGSLHDRCMTSLRINDPDAVKRLPHDMASPL